MHRSQSEGTPSHNSEDESDYHEHEVKGSNTRSKSSAGSKKKPAPARRTSSAHTAAGDDLHHHDDPSDPQNARKMQNRLAQREFRARRLEHIKELEARVEFLSKPQSEQTEILVAIIHGLMDENKQLRGSLKTMANFVSTGLGGFSNAIQLPQYDDALDLVNRGDKALLLKLVNEKVGSHPHHAGTSGHEAAHDATKASGSKVSPSPTPPLTATAEKKRKSEAASEESSNRPAPGKVPRTRSQLRNRPEPVQPPSREFQQNTPRDTPPVLMSSSVNDANGRPPAGVTSQGQESAGQPLAQPSSSISISHTGIRAQGAQSADIFRSFLDTSSNALSGFNAFGNNGIGSGPASAASNSNAASTFAGTTVKQEESPTVPTFQDPAQAWMNAYTNLTPMGGNESFWSLTSSAMNLQAQPPIPSSDIGTPQDGRSPSSANAFIPPWGTISSNPSNAMSAFAMPQQSGMQQPLHGYA